MASKKVVKKTVPPVTGIFDRGDINLTPPTLSPAPVVPAFEVTAKRINNVSIIDKIMQLPAAVWREAVERKGYAFFDGVKPYDLNIIAVRNTAAALDSNLFDDIIAVIYRDSVGGALLVTAFEATTNAGKTYLENPMNDNGTAVMIPNQYRGAYMLGKHKGLPALVQCKPVGFERVKKIGGVYVTVGKENTVIGANIHRAINDIDGVANFVNGFSAACQVLRRTREYINGLLRLAVCATPYWGDSFTYTLLEDTDFNFAFGGVITAATPVT